MCTIIAKHFPDLGWVAVKNRDRNYIPEISFHRDHHKEGTERLIFKDDVTNYMEGINSFGVGILSASLMVQDDEKEISKGRREHSSDGIKIREALKYPTAKYATQSAIKDQLTGNTVFVDRKHCILLEASKSDGKYVYKAHSIPENKTIARTNHGIWLDWAGYQHGIDENQELSRISSEARRLQGQFVVEHANDPEDMIDGLCHIYIDHPQLNVMRTSTERKKMRTTAQIMLIPTEATMYCRPVSSHMTFDFWKLNRPDADTWVEILSNRALYQKVHDADPPFGQLNNFHKVDEYAGSRIY